MATVDAATLPLAEEVPQAPLNTPVDHQDLATSTMDASLFLDAILEALASDGPDVAVGNPTLVPPNSPAPTYAVDPPLNGSAMDDVHGYFVLTSLDEAISPLAGAKTDDGGESSMDGEHGSQSSSDTASEDGMTITRNAFRTGAGRKEQRSRPASPEGHGDGSGVTEPSSEGGERPSDHADSVAVTEEKFGELGPLPAFRTNGGLRSVHRSRDDGNRSQGT